MVFKEKVYEVEFTEECMKEIDDIYKYISEQLVERKAAKRLIETLKNKILNLETSPHIYMKIGKTNRLNEIYHRMVVKNYIILYTIDDKNKKVFISHMYYGKRNYLK